MLVVSPLRGRKDDNEKEMERYAVGIDEFPDFSTDNLLESIDFDDLFVGFDGGDSLPDLDIGEFSGSGGEEYSTEIINTTSSFDKVLNEGSKELNKEEREGNLGSTLCTKGDNQEVGSGSDESIVVNLVGKEVGKGKKSLKNHNGKRKVKVDWTPELHRRFVQAVEQLGVDKAVPSRILELMGIDCLTRHNIASHLQKYRSHRKHMLARETEAASWSQRRQMYTTTGVATSSSKRDMNGAGPWLAAAPPTMGFPPMAPVHPHFRPLHVWGHPPNNQPLVHTWPKHIVSPPTTRIPPDSSLWHAYPQRVPGGFAPGTPYFPPPVLPPTKHQNQAGVTGMNSHPTVGTVVPTTHSPNLDLHPSKESIDAVIGDVLSKPWQPLPLGLRPPALDSVLVELNRHGVPKVPPVPLEKP